MGFSDKQLYEYDPEERRLEKEIERSERRDAIGGKVMIDPISLVRQQAEDDALWSESETAPEAYLQHHLRQLHEAVEGSQWTRDKPSVPGWYIIAERDDIYLTDVTPALRVGDLSIHEIDGWYYGPIPELP
jgi:hypothetical protein